MIWQATWAWHDRQLARMPGAVGPAFMIGLYLHTWSLLFKKSGLVSFLNTLAPASLVIAVAAFLLDMSAKREERDVRTQTLKIQSWALFDRARGANGNQGQIDAITRLRRLGVDLRGLDTTRVVDVKGEKQVVGTHFAGISMRGANLAASNFSHSNLEGANFEDAFLAHAKFDHARLGCAHNWDEVIRGIHLHQFSPLTERCTTFRDAVLLGSSFMHADMSFMDLRNAALDFADLSSARLYYTDLTGASLKSAKLIGARLTGAFLKGANFSNANLSSAKFWVPPSAIEKMMLENARDLAKREIQLGAIPGVSVEMMNLKPQPITQTQLDSACFDPGIGPPILPDGLSPPKRHCS